MDLDQEFEEFRQRLAAHHALGHVNLSDGLTPGSSLDEHNHHVLSGFSSRCETHWNPRSSEYRKSVYNDDSEQKEERYIVRGRVMGICSSNGNPCEIKALAVRRGNYYGTPFYLRLAVDGPEHIDAGDDEEHEEELGVHSDVATTSSDNGEYKVVYNGSMFAPLQDLYDVELEVTNITREGLNGLETITVTREVLKRTINRQALYTTRGMCTLLSYVLGVEMAKAQEIYRGSGFKVPQQWPDGMDWRVIPNDSEVKPIMETECAYLVHQAMCKAMADLDYKRSDHKIDDTYQEACFDINFGREAYDKNYRAEKYETTEKYDGLKMRMPPTALALFCRHPEVLYVFGTIYLQKLGDCAPEDGGPMYSMEFLQGLSLTCLRELYWYACYHPTARRLFWGSDKEMDQLEMTPAQRLFFHTTLEPRGNHVQRDPASPDYYDLRMVSLPHKYSRRRAIIPLEELWMEYLSNVSPLYCRSQRYGATVFGMCVLLYGLMKQSHYVDKNSCLPRLHLYGRFFALLDMPVDDTVREAINEHSSRFRLTGRKNRATMGRMKEKAQRWLSQALTVDDLHRSTDLYHFLQEKFHTALDILCQSDHLGVLIREYQPGVKDDVYYLRQPYMFERTIVQGIGTICQQFEASPNHTTGDGSRAITMNPLVVAACQYGWDKETVEAISAVVQNHYRQMAADIVRMNTQIPEDEDDFPMPDVLPQFSYAECPEAYRTECERYYLQYDPRSVEDLLRMAYFGPEGSYVPHNFHPVCSEQLLGFESVGRYPVLCITGQAGSGKSDLGLLMFAGAAHSPQVDNVMGMTFMSAHCSTLQMKMCSTGITYPVSTIHQFMEWHAKTCTRHPHMPNELRLKAKGLWKYVAKEKVPLWGAAAASGDCHECLLEKLEVILIDEAGLLYDELLAQLMNILSRCAKRLVTIVFIGDVNQLDPVQPGHPFFQMIASGLGSISMQHTHRAEMRKLVQLSRNILDGDVEGGEWNDMESTFNVNCSDSERSIKAPTSMLSRLMALVASMGLSYRDTMIACHSNADCRQVSRELDTFYLEQVARRRGGSLGQLNFQALALGPTRKVKLKTYYPNQLILLKKHFPALNISTNEVLQVYDVVMGTYIRIPYPVVSQMRQDLWKLMVDAILEPSSLAARHPELRETFEAARAIIRGWREKTNTEQPRPCTSEDVLVAALKDKYRVLLTSHQRENATAQCREAWNHWLVALEVYKNRPQQVLANERSRQELGDWPPDGHSYFHWHPASYAHRERREFSNLLSDAECTNTTGPWTGEWIDLLQGTEELMHQLRQRDVSLASTDSLLYRMMCECAVDLLLGLRHDLGIGRAAAGGGPDLDPLPHINPLIRVNPKYQPRDRAAAPSLAESESYRPLDAPPAQHSAWWTCETIIAEERQFIESQVPSGRCVMMAVTEHEQQMKEKVADMIQVAKQTAARSGHTSKLVLHESLLPFADDRLAPPDENDYVIFKPEYRAAHSRVQCPDEGKMLRFMRCVVRSTYGKITKDSVVFVPCTESFERYLRPASAVTFYACQSKQVTNMVFAARYPMDLPTLYTAFTRAERRFFAVAAPGVLDESLKRKAEPRISFMHRKLAQFRGQMYQSRTPSPAMQQALQTARHRQHSHSEAEESVQKLCFQRQSDLVAPDEPRQYTLGERREKWLRTVAC